ncbi:MAG: ATP-dependent sacrificial sulfur transferase LarE [Blautia sp.]|nr:ATP-dependent sacrificial sulfur transferase LarE [Blautia sp.]
MSTTASARSAVTEPSPAQWEKYDHLKQYLAALGSAAVAFSGGVDSTLLLRAAREALGEKVIAVTVSAGFVPGRELKEAQEFCAAEGVRQYVCSVDMSDIEGFSQNPPDRCYICKKQIFSRIMRIAGENGIEHVAEGSNMDDTGDYRPGMRAIAELGVLSPLRACGLWKEDIRVLSHALGLPTWKKPSFACLASRFVYGEEITPEKLGMVEKAEQFLMDLGFTQFRVRIHGTLARIELLPDSFPQMMEEATRLRVCEALRSYGFSYVSLDLVGYRTGSMNETLS